MVMQIEEPVAVVEGVVLRLIVVWLYFHSVGIRLLDLELLEELLPPPPPLPPIRRLVVAASPSRHRVPEAPSAARESPAVLAPVARDDDPT